MTKRLIDVDDDKLRRFGPCWVPALEATVDDACDEVLALDRRRRAIGPASPRAMRGGRSAWPFVELDQAVLHRAVAVQDSLAGRSQQRGPRSPTS